MEKSNGEKSNREENHLTAEQQIAVIRRAIINRYFLYTSDGKNFSVSHRYRKPYTKEEMEFVESMPMPFDEALTRLASLCPEPPRWQDDKGWQGVVATCDNQHPCTSCGCWDMANTDCLLRMKCGVKGIPCYPKWHPPLNPATNEPYLTLAEWQADNPVKAATEFPDGLTKGMIQCMAKCEMRVHCYKCDCEEYNRRHNCSPELARILLGYI